LQQEYKVVSSGSAWGIVEVAVAVYDRITGNFRRNCC
jgi:hypothetical protein